MYNWMNATSITSHQMKKNITIYNKIGWVFFLQSLICGFAFFFLIIINNNDNNN